MSHRPRAQTQHGVLADLALAAGVTALLALSAKKQAWRSTPGRVRPPRAARPRCGARTRAGNACRAPVVWLVGAPAPRNGRCRMHGGLSTGPRTPEGRARCGEAGRRNLVRAMALRLASALAPS
jgi:hypothetical protein